MYNIAVHQDHTYFASAQGLWVHNVCYGAKQLQKKSKHAADFGVSGSYNPRNAQLFEAALQRHMLGSQAISGTYRSAIKGTHYFDAAAGLWQFIDDAGSFVTGFRLDAGQIAHLLPKTKLW